jgi:peptidyl-tRNA hydrolase, PTH1 family
MSVWQSLAAALGLAGSQRPVESIACEQPMKLVVGLGNHGSKYEGTRHNAGYAVVDRLAEMLGPVQFRRQFAGRIASAKQGDQKVLLLKPETYMNQSGQSVQPALAFYRLPVEDLLVICDDLNLPVGKIRIRKGGSDGGQKGLRSLTQHLATTEYPRLRVGIGAAPSGIDAADYVLSRFTRDERKQMDLAIDQAADAVVTWCESGIESCMNRFN